MTREQIRLAIWGEDTFVDFEQGLNFCIRQIRMALHDQAEKAKLCGDAAASGISLCWEDGKKRGRPRCGCPGGRKETADCGGSRGGVCRKGRRLFLRVGLTEDMISALSRIDPARLRVTSVPRLESGDGMADHLDRLQKELNLDSPAAWVGEAIRGYAARISAQLHDLARPKRALVKDLRSQGERTCLRCRKR